MDEVLMNDSPDTVLQSLVNSQPMLWRGSEQPYSSNQSVPTGYEELDRFLPTGGWPTDSLTEIVVSNWGNGEFQILLPFLSRVSHGPFPIVFIAPPHIPYAPALQHAGVLLEKLIIIDSEISSSDLWWAAEKTLRHPESGTVLTWAKQYSPRHVRRLQLAANTAKNPGFLFRCGNAAQSPAPLRIQLTRSTDHITVHILKSRFGWRQNHSLSLHLI